MSVMFLHHGHCAVQCPPTLPSPAHAGIARVSSFRATMCAYQEALCVVLKNGVARLRWKDADDTQMTRGQKILLCA